MNVDFKVLCCCEKAAVCEGRIFEKGSYENRDQWENGFNVRIQGEEAAVSLLTGGWDRGVNDKLEKFVKSVGAQSLHWERRGEKKSRAL